MLEREEAAKPTLALEYTFGRKSNLNLSKVRLPDAEAGHIFLVTFQLTGHSWQQLDFWLDVCVSMLMFT